MKTFDLVTRAIHHARTTGEIGIAVIIYDFTLFGKDNKRYAGEFFVCQPNGDIKVEEFVEVI